MQEQENQREVIAVIHKGAKQQIHISLATFRGRRFADVRLYVLKDGDFIPTQKGVTVPPELIQELQEAVGRLRDASACARSHE